MAAGSRIGVQGANIGYVPLVVGPEANGCVAWAYDPAAVNGAAKTPAAATIYLMKMMVPKTTTFTNMVVRIVQGGNNYTNAQMGLYNSSGTFLVATAVQASAGTNGFGTAGNGIIALTTPTTVTGGSGVFVWGALHMGTNGATTVTVQGSVTGDAVNVGVGVTSARFGTYTGHATNDLATIGNLTPASITSGSSIIWIGAS